MGARKHGYHVAQSQTTQGTLSETIFPRYCLSVPPAVWDLSLGIPKKSPTLSWEGGRKL